MKVEITTYLLDFLSNQGYRYLLLQSKSTGRKSAVESFSFIPVKDFQNISHYYSGSTSCFYLEAEPRLMAEGIKGKAFFVFLSHDEALEFKGFLEDKALRKRAYVSTLN